MNQSTDIEASRLSGLLSFMTPKVVQPNLLPDISTEIPLGTLTWSLTIKTVTDVLPTHLYRVGQPVRIHADSISNSAGLLSGQR